MLFVPLAILRDARKSALLRMTLQDKTQSFLNTIDAIQPVISAMKAVTRP
jgi:hypothetical protein